MRLGNLSKNIKARIIHNVNIRLLEFGFIENSIVEIIHEAPFSNDPIIVRVREALVALRRQEANDVEVELL